MHGGRFPTSRRFASTALLVAFVATGVLGGFFSSAKPARAFVVTDAATTYLAGQAGYQKVKATILDAIVNTAAIAFLNMSRYALQRIAYDAANYVASGDWGQKPLFLTEGLDSYLGNVGKDALGEAIGTISELGGFEKLGINLCSPPDPRVALNIKLGFLNGLPGQIGGPLGPGQPKPKCDFNQIVDNWDSFVSQDSDDVLDNVGVMFTPGQSTLDVALQFQGYSRDILSKSQTTAINEYVGNKGFKPVTAKIAQWTLTPAEVVRSEGERARKEAGDKETTQSTMITGAAFQKGLVYGVLGAAAATFASTIGEKVMKKIFEKGLITLSQAKVEHINILGLFQGSGDVGGGRAAAQLANADLLTARLTEVPNFSELVDFATCPDGFRGINNCVIDQAFYTAVSRADEGASITLRQAVEQGFLRGNFRLLPQSHPKNTDRNCYLEAFCYSNLAKLRRARIIPIGWELAANSPQNDPSRPITLREVMDRFNDCPVDTEGNVDETKLPDPLHPWCHLINPEWILTYPTAICRQQAPGPLLVSAQGDQRAQTCVDTASCIAEDSAGNCVGGYGYCMREKSNWKLDADACPAYYASCQAVEKRGGGTAAYLMNTAETGICGSENAGCLSYSTVANAVPNASFEDVLLVGGAPKARDWTYGPGVLFDRTSLKSVSGRSAIGVNSTNVATAAAARVPADAELKLSASAFKELAGATGIGRVRLQFHDRYGADVAKACAKTTSGGLPKPCTDDDDCSAGDACQDVVIETTCIQDGGGRVTLEAPATSFGHASAACDVRAPKNAVSATIALSASVSGADRIWFDQVALSGAAYSAAPADLRYVDDQAKSCSGDQAGCTALFPQRRTSLNLIPNPGFEKTATDDRKPLDWTIGAAEAHALDALGAFEGSGYVNLAAAGTVSQTIQDLLPEASYAFSMHVKDVEPDATETGKAVLRIRDADGNVVAPIETSCELVGDEMRMPYESGESFVRPDCLFTTPADGFSLDIEITADSGSDTTYLDAVQLELAVLPTPYHEGLGTSGSIHMKVAPEGLGCTGSAQDPLECGRYAQACLRREVGCTLFTPKVQGTAVPAIAGPGDLCPAACSGYATFRQEPTNFVDEKFPQFFIPTTGRACSASEAGCEEFTNVEELARGGEARQAFTYLRSCFQPDDRTATYYTWEGSDARGYQLRAWSLMRSDLTAVATGLGGSDPTGGVGPCTAIRYDSLGRPQCADATSVSACSKAEMRFNPDCREYFDVDGNIHYRRHSKTILSTTGCREFRMTKSDQANCESHGGLWRNEECHQFAYAPESSSCRLEASGCRAYNGAAARNVRIAFDDGFEALTTAGWTDVPGADPTSAISNSSESVAQGGHSLKSTATVMHKDVSDELRRNRQYLLTFWAKGSGELDIRFSQAGDVPFTFNRTTSSTAEVALTGEWNSYTVGPVLAVASPAIDAADPAANERLIFANGAASAVTPFYIDNVQLREVASSIYLIEGSWRTPAACDQDPVGNASPQYMLGCQAYTDQRGASGHLKSFSGICRPEAVGCEAFYDGRNTASSFATSHNAVCTLTDASGAPTACVPTAGSVTCPCESAVRGVEREVCQVVRGSADCRYASDDDAGRALSSVEPTIGHISPDGDTVMTPKDGLIYLIDEPSKRCEAEQAGCTAFGSAILNQDGDAIVGWSEVFKIDHEKDYARALCTKTEEFCQAYTRVEDGTPTYFKEPGKHLCDFRSNVTIEGISVSGWFKKGLDEPCYPVYLQAGNFYGIWKNADTDYERWVGECKPEFSLCKEFIDVADTSEDQPKGQPYYAIMNDRLDVASCGSRVSLQRSPTSAVEASACVLFRRTDDFSLTFNATATYAVSEASGGALVEPVKNSANDSNLIIRVERDRRCAEWLDCRSSEKVWNQAGGSFQNVCTSLGLCTEYQQVGDASRCVRFSDSETSGLVLDPKAYAGREAGARDRDYSGYSVPYRYPAHELTTVDVSNDAENPDPRLVYSIGPCSNGYGEECGSPNNRGYRGSCLGTPGHRQCVYAIDGSRSVSARSQLLQSSGLSRYPSVACRAYPQESSPFPSSAADPAGWNTLSAEINGGSPVLVSPSANFAGANICQRRVVNGVEFSSCECNYQIGTYGGSSAKRYFDIEDPGVPAGYCDGGTYDAHECDPRASGVRTAGNLSCCSTIVEDGGGFGSGRNSIECADGGICQSIKKLERVIGYEGQCLERDLSTPINNRADEFACLTWRPVTFVGGGRDIYNLHQTAGYFAPPSRRFYCVGSLSQPVDPNDFSKGYKGYSFKTGINGADADSDFITGEDGKRMYVPPFQPITKLFGPGKVNNAIPNFQSGTKGSIVSGVDTNHGGSGVNCANVNDPEHQGGWCIYPGLSKLNITKAVETDDSSAANDEIPNGYRLTGDAIGPLGCYEVADEGSAAETYIDFPYIGPPIYKDQLLSIDFDMKSGLNRGESLATNPNQDVSIDCSDETEGNDRALCGGTITGCNYQFKYGGFDGDADSMVDGPVFTSDFGDDLTGFPRPLPPDGDNSCYHCRKATARLDHDNKFLTDAARTGRGNLIFRADFDAYGRFVNLHLAAADNEGGKEEGTFAIRSMSFTFRPGCESVVMVDEPGEFGLTKAYTDRVNAYRDFTGFGPYEVSDPAQACLPWGSIGIASVPAQSPWTYVAIHKDHDEEGNRLTLQCTSESFRSGSFYDKYDKASFGAADSDEDDEYGGSPFGRVLQRIFRKVFGLWDYKKLKQPDGPSDDFKQQDLYKPASKSRLEDLDLTGADEPELDFLYGNVPPPRIASVATARCEAGTCPVGRVDAITVNGKERGVIQGQNGSLVATSEFFAWASHNAMPIRSRIMYWGDTASKEPPATGWYKNQKPFCSASAADEGAINECKGYSGLTCRTDADCPTGVTCDAFENYCSGDDPATECGESIDDPFCEPKECDKDSDCGDRACIRGNHFGNTPGACTEAPYRFEHIYTCGHEDLVKLKGRTCSGDADMASNAPCLRVIGGTPTCTYRPAAQVIDNWGWCNCTGTGCESSGGNHGDKCAPGSGSGEPWTAFEGEVRVTPRAEDLVGFSLLPSYGGDLFSEIYSAQQGYYQLYTKGFSAIFGAEAVADPLEVAP